MVTLSVTPSRVRDVLRKTADLLEAEGRDPEHNPVICALDRGADYRPGTDNPAGEAATVQAWDALVTYLDEQLVVPWEKTPGRTQAEVLAALRAAAESVPS